MEEISKKDLIQNILESQEMDEMGYNPRWQSTSSKSGRKEKGQGEPKFNKETGEWEYPEPSRVKTLFPQKPEHETLKKYVTKKDGRVEQLPIGYVVNPLKNIGKGVVFVSLNENETEELLKENKVWAEWFEDVVTPLIGTNPSVHTVDPEATVHFVDWIKDVGYAEDKRYPEYLQKITPSSNEKLMAKTGVDLISGKGSKEMTSREKFLRDLYPTIREKLSGLNETMLMMGFPSIEFNTQEAGKQKRFTDTYSTKENEDVSLESHNVFTYNNYREFAEEASDILDIHEYPDADATIKIDRVGENQARQKNPGIRWNFERKQVKTSDAFKRDPLTRVYKLDKEGKKAEEKDYITVTFFNLNGKYEDNKYTWDVAVRVEISEKLREESLVYGRGKNLKELVTFRKSASVNVPHGLNYSPTSSILRNHPQIRIVLEKVLDELRDELISYDPVPQLKDRIFKKRSETTKKYDLSENEIVGLIKQTIHSTNK